MIWKAYFDHAYAQNLAKPPFMHICREFENRRDLRALSGKFLQQKSCYPESLRFLWLCLGTLLCPTTLLVRNKVHLHHIISRSLSKRATLFKWETSSMSSFISFFQSKRKRLSNRQLQHEDSKDQPLSPPAPCHHQDETSIDNTSITSKSTRSLNNKKHKIRNPKLIEAASYYSNCLLFPNWSSYIISSFLSFEDNLNSKDECFYDTIVLIM